MSHNILNRDSFISEVYTHKTDNEMNEGLLDFFRAITKNEWSKIKSKNTSLRDSLKSIDDGLKGFSLMKIKNASQCAEVRQTITDFANTLLDSKIKEMEEGAKLQKLVMGLKDKDKVSDEDKKAIKNAGEVSSYMKQYDLKDKALVDKLKTYEKRINELSRENPNLLKWANIMKDEVRNLINDFIISEYEKNAKDNEKEKKRIERLKKANDEQKKQEEKEAQEKNKKEQEYQKKKIKQIEQERSNLLKSVGVKPLTNQTGDKAITTLNTSFDNLIKESLLLERKKSHKSKSKSTTSDETKDESVIKLTDAIKKNLEGDIYFGFKNMMKSMDTNEITKEQIQYILSELNVVFDVVKEYTSKFEDTPCDSVHAMFVGLTKAIQYGICGDKYKLDKNDINLLAKCAIDSDKTIGYGIPLLDDKKPDGGNIFTVIMQALKDAQDKKGVFKNNKDLRNQFTDNMSTLFDQIFTTAKKLKEQQKKQDEADSKKETDEENKKNK
jgi:hypothetical protein